MTDRNRPLIDLSRCSVILDGKAALDEVSFALRRGERWALVGPNGSGKTLLLKMLRGDVWPTPTGREQRTYAFDGNISREPAGSKERIAYVGPERQDKYVRYDWNLSVEAIVTTGVFDEDIPLTRPTRAQRARVERLLHRFGLWGLRRRRLLTLSYGQRRIVLVARAFASLAPVLLLDEVFNGLDVRARTKLQQALEKPRAGHAWILTSHRPKELPRNITHVAYMESGRIVHAGKAERPLPTLPRKRGRGSAAIESARAAGARVSGSAARTPGREGKEADLVRAAGAQVSGSAARNVHAGKAERPLPTLPRKRGRGSAAIELARTGGARSSGSLPRAARGRGREGAWLVRIRDADFYRDYRAVLRNVNWTLRRGEHWAVLGANGSGKSTLLSALYGDLHPALGGRIERAGVPPGTHIEQWKRRVGWVSPELQADYHAANSIEEIVISGRYSSVGLNEPATARDATAARRWLEYFGIDSLKHRGPRQVSYGQLRLALLARAMVNAPELLLLDEPATGLGGDVRDHVLAALQRLAEEGTQIVMAVHEPEDMIPAIENVLVIERGRARAGAR